MLAAAVLEQIQGLKLTKDGAAVLDWNDDMHRSQRRPQARGHVLALPGHFQACRSAAMF